MKAVDELEEFLLSDLPTKIFPEEIIRTGVWIREDKFNHIWEVRDYIEEHIKIFRKQLEKEQQK